MVAKNSTKRGPLSIESRMMRGIKRLSLKVLKRGQRCKLFKEDSSLYMVRQISLKMKYIALAEKAP